MFSPQAPAQQLPLRMFSQPDGLANQSLTSLAQDRRGYIWVGTENGLFRFDGARLQRYGRAEGLRDTFITALHIDGHDRLWTATGTGLCYWEHGRCIAVPAPDGQPIRVWPGQHLAAHGADGVLAVHERELLVIERAGHGGWQARPYFNAAQRSTWPELDRIYSVTVAADGALWLGCMLQVCRYQDGAVTRYGEAQGVPRDEWRGLFAARQGEMWMRSQRHMRSLPAGAARAVLHAPPGVAQGTVRLYFPMAQDADGTIISTNDEGLLRGRAGHWQQYGPAEGLLADGGISALLHDRDGELWLAVTGRGLAHWRGYGNWENWTAAQGLPSNDVWSFFRSREGLLHLGSGRGMAVQAPGERRFRVVSGDHQGVDHQHGSMLQDADGNLWSGTFSGALIRQDGRTGRSATVAQLPLILRLLIDQSGQLWIGTNTGLYVIRTPLRSHTPVAVQDLPLPRKGPTEVSAICQTSNGALWFATGRGLLRLANGAWSLAAQPPPSRRWNMLSCRGNQLWLADGSEAGLWRGAADAAGGQPELTAVPLPAAQLGSRSLMSMHVDRRGWLWLGTDDGLLVSNGSSWRLFNQHSGLIWNDTNQYAIAEDADGSIWVGSTAGASHIVQPAALFAANVLQLDVESVRYGAEALELGQGKGKGKGQARLPWTGAALEVKVAALSFRSRDATRFRYRLKGLEQDWSLSGTDLLRYPALAPGRYVLQLSAENIPLQERSALLELPLEIMPPWWQTPWFHGACALLAALAGWLLYRWRLHGVLQRHADMERLVRERTAELEASREDHRQRALRDGLTQAWNRGAIMELIRQQILAASTCAHGAAPFVLVLLDLDHFKKINDSHGHLAGDTVLRECVRRMSQEVRDSDAVGRYGGEEFIVLLAACDRAGAAARIAALHRAMSSTPVLLGDGTEIHASASFGVVQGPQPGCTPESLLELADLALYRAKENGRNCIEYA